jgi:hypothetical protein
MQPVLAAVDLAQHVVVELAGAPSNTMRPPDIPTTRSAKRRARLTSCMFTSTGMSRERARSVSSCMISTDVRGIERRGRLIGEQQARRLHDRPRDTDRCR